MNRMKIREVPLLIKSLPISRNQNRARWVSRPVLVIITSYDLLLLDPHMSCGFKYSICLIRSIHFQVHMRMSAIAVQW